MTREIEQENKNGIYDRRNTLNDLTGQEWLKLTASFWFSEKCAMDKDAMKHPAPYLIKDIEKLIKLFTKQKMTVLDPFCGSGTTLLSCLNLGRKGIGFDLNNDYRELALSRVKKIKDFKDLNELDLQYELGNSLDLIKKIEHNSIDYIVTSPPYHNILKNKSQGIRTDKAYKGFRDGGRIGVKYYSDHIDDLGNCDNYESFIAKLSMLMVDAYKVLKYKKYCSIVISDFTVDKKEVNVQGDIIRMMQKIGFEFSGTTILLQNNKPLYPFGYPYAYKINHHHQNIITFRKV